MYDTCTGLSAGLYRWKSDSEQGYLFDLYTASKVGVGVLVAESSRFLLVAQA